MTALATTQIGSPNGDLRMAEPAGRPVPEIIDLPKRKTFGREQGPVRKWLEQQTMPAFLDPGKAIEIPPEIVAMAKSPAAARTTVDRFLKAHGTTRTFRGAQIGDRIFLVSR